MDKKPPSEPDGEGRGKRQQAGAQPKAKKAAGAGGKEREGGGAPAPAPAARPPPQPVKLPRAPSAAAQQVLSGQGSPTSPRPSPFAAHAGGGGTAAAKPAPQRRWAVYPPQSGQYTCVLTEPVLREGELKVPRECTRAGKGARGLPAVPWRCAPLRCRCFMNGWLACCSLPRRHACRVSVPAPVPPSCSAATVWAALFGSSLHKEATVKAINLGAFVCLCGFHA